MASLCEVTGCKEEGESVTLLLQTSPPFDGGLSSVKKRLCKTHRVGPESGVACPEGTPVRLVFNEKEQ
jgi:hypothetical protein